MFAQLALDAVAAHGARIHLARHRQAEARGAIARQPVQAHQGIGRAAGLLEHARIVGARAYPCAARKSRAHLSKKPARERAGSF